jgi:hypothetical protein
MTPFARDLSSRFQFVAHDGLPAAVWRQLDPPGLFHSSEWITAMGSRIPGSAFAFVVGNGASPAPLLGHVLPLRDQCAADLHRLVFPKVNSYDWRAAAGSGSGGGAAVLPNRPCETTTPASTISAPSGWYQLRCSPSTTTPTTMAKIGIR